MRRAVGAALVILALTLPSATAGTVGSHTRPRVLTSFANIGTVYWRCGGHGWSLGFRVYANSADAYVNGRHLRPGQETWFRTTTPSTRKLTAKRGIEPNTLTGRVTAHFHGCFRYEPPTFSSSLSVVRN